LARNPCAAQSTTLSELRKPAWHVRRIDPKRVAGLVGAFIAVPLAAVAEAVIDFSRSR
jgi:hypothetical protein